MTFLEAVGELSYLLATTGAILIFSSGIVSWAIHMNSREKTDEKSIKLRSRR